MARALKVVAVYSTKGGVGKTSTAVNLAWEAHHRGRVLLWDLDPQGAATFLLQVAPTVKGGVGTLVSGENSVASAIRSTDHENLDVLPADASYRDLDLVFDHAKKSEQRVAKILEQVAHDYDVVILDCPPGAALVAENAIFSADAVVVPLVPSPLSVRSLEQVTEFVAASRAASGAASGSSSRSGSAKKATIVAFLSMVDRRKTLHRAAVEHLPRASELMSDVVIPATVMIERMGTERAPLAIFAPRSDAAQAYADLWARVAATVGLAKSAGKATGAKRRKG